MSDFINIAAESERQAANILAQALEKRFCTARDWAERQRDVESAHRLLECAAMLRAASQPNSERQAQ